MESIFKLLIKGMTIKKLSESVSQMVGLKHQTINPIIEATISAISDELLRGEKIKLTGIGTLQILHKHKKAYYSINKQEIIPSSKEYKIIFKQDKRMKQTLCN